MKQMFLTIATVIAIVLVTSCNNQKDCSCIEISDEAAGKVSEPFIIEDYEKSCEDIKWSDLSELTDGEIEADEEMFLILECTEVRY